MSLLAAATATSPNVDTEVLRNAIRLIHFLQKERGLSCAYYCDSVKFENAMMEARSATDVSGALVQSQTLPVLSSLAKIRNLIATRKNFDGQADELALHRIFICFNTLISCVVHECILKQIDAGTGKETQASTIKNRHRKGLSMDINDKIASTLTVTPDSVEDHKTFPAKGTNGQGAARRANPRLRTLYSTEDLNSSGSGKPPPPPPAPATSNMQGSRSPKSDVIRSGMSSPSNKKVNFGSHPPKVRQILELLHLFVQLKESSGVERAILSCLLALRGTEDKSLTYLTNDLILEVENQRALVHQLEKLPEDDHRNLVLDLASLSPRLQELQEIILSDLGSLQHAEYDAEMIWSLITIYIDKLHSVELLLVEELECSYPAKMRRAISSGALSSLVAPPANHKPLKNLSPVKNLFSAPTIEDESSVVNEALQKVFPSTGSNDLVVQLTALPADEIKTRILKALKVDEEPPAEPEKEDSQSNGHHYGAVVSLKDEMNRALQSTPQKTASKEWDISIYELKFTKRIGAGAAATTYLADWSGQHVAVKVASASRFGLDGWKTEVDALQRLHHPNIIRLLGSVYHENPLTYCLVLEYCNAGDLATVMRYPTPKNFFFTVSLSIANAMAYLHSRRVIHRDLKPANVLCDGNVASGKFTVKVTDFGVATEVEGTVSPGDLEEGSKHPVRNLTGETGTYRWMAPEVIRHEPYTTRADVYSFAIMLWQFVTHEEPFMDVSAMDAARLVGMERKRPSLPSKTPATIARAIEVNWSDDPKNRWPMEKVAEALRKFQNEVTLEERTFVEAPNGHPVYNACGEEEDEGAGAPAAKGGAKGPPKLDDVANMNKRGSYLSQFFGKRMDRKKKGG
eukprot:Nitzschia sp. Nitz4//scaffold39_size137210//54112//56685//NITZ4_003197-RA/size137210-processed-gene-0.112-mRNA-1//-1//CDS//3329550377//3058//frame0